MWENVEWDRLGDSYKDKILEQYSIYIHISNTHDAIIR